jgi:uncharacterized protein YjdB
MSVPVTGINPITIQLGFDHLNNVGDSITAYSTVNPENATNKVINWSSSDTRYLSVINHPSLQYFGQVTGAGQGVADIIAVSADGGFVARYVNFYIGGSAPVFVSGINNITAAGSATTVAAGSTLALSTSVTPANAFNQKINWYSSDPSKATVNSSGVVTGVAGGSVDIIAESANGGFIKTYTLQVTTTGISSVTLNSPMTFFTPGQQSTYTATVVSDGETDTSVVWSSSTPGVATVTSGGVVTAVADGTATITVTAVEGGLSDSVFVVVSSTSVPCFPTGTMIATPNGYVPVETIKNGDLLLTADGRSVAVSTFVSGVDNTTTDTAPYTIPKNALAEGLPKADTRLSPWHAFMVGPNAWQKPAIASLYYKTIKQDKLGESVVYYHFEAPNYLRDNFVTNGMIVESYAANQLKSANPYTFNKEKAYFTRMLANSPARTISH